jgi:proteasome lid subunit RPN8/RPN11
MKGLKINTTSKNLGGTLMLIANPIDYKVVFSNRAYNAIIAEAERMNPKETGGVLMGYFLDTGFWVVMEVLLPGPLSNYHEYTFEYDDKYLNYTARGVSAQYKIHLEVIGLWHRHPGSMDVFSGVDGKTNSDFAARFPYGAISGLVNFDPNFRFTMYHVSPQSVAEMPSSHIREVGLLGRKIYTKFTSLQQITPKPKYTKIEHFVGDDFIPPHFFSLRYYPLKNEQQTNTTNDQGHPNKES